MKKLLNKTASNLVEEEKIMKIGTIVRVVKGESTIGIVGQRAEIVDLQMQEFERYRVYPVWARILAGERQGRVCGFHYDEVEVAAKESGLLATAEEILRRVPTA